MLQRFNYTKQPDILYKNNQIFDKLLVVLLVLIALIFRSSRCQMFPQNNYFCKIYRTTSVPESLLSESCRVSSWNFIKKETLVQVLNSKYIYIYAVTCTVTHIYIYIYSRYTYIYIVDLKFYNGDNEGTLAFRKSRLVESLFSFLSVLLYLWE